MKKRPVAARDSDRARNGRVTKVAPRTSPTATTVVLRSTKSVTRPAPTAPPSAVGNGAGAPLCRIDVGAAVAHLAKADTVLRRLIKTLPACDFPLRPRRPPFETLARAIAYQQLNGTAAETILGRFIGLFPGRSFPRPEDLANVADDEIRGAGFSGAKTAALRDLAAKTIEGVVPTNREIGRLADEDIVTRLTAVRGVGRWTVEMLLIFQLGRGDVLPIDDFGIRKGFANAYGLDELPKPKALLAHGERWRPHRTVASWYLWRASGMT